MKRATRRPYLRLVYAAPLVLIFGLLESPQTADTFGGRAFAAFVNAPSLGASALYVADSGELSAGGGWEAADELGAEVPSVLKAEVLNAATTGHDDSAASSASLANVTVLAGQAAQLTASFVLAEAWATTTGTRGSTQVYDVTFGGVSVEVTGLPNQRIEIPGLLGPVAALTINEQTVTGSGSSQAITTNALHLVLATGEEIILGSARSRVDATAPLIVADGRSRANPPGTVAVAREQVAWAGKAAPADFSSRLATVKPASMSPSAVPPVLRNASDSDACGGGAGPATKVMNLLRSLGLRPAVLEAWEEDCFDFVTWGLFFFGSSDGDGKVDSGGNAGFKNGPPPPPLMVHLNLVDHNMGRHIKLQDPTTPDAYRPGTFFEDPCHCRQFNGTGTQTLDGVTTEVSGLVEVCDFSEPGNSPKGSDAFMIGVDGYFASARPIIGGNAQLHKTKQCPADGCA